MVLAEELAKQQRSISVAEFFEKNKHLLGFDSPTRGVITTIKEAVDNALDACEEAQVLPDIFISIKKTGTDIFRIIVEDNGPGIVPAQIPFVFGKLLYGSRFHQIRQTRGQQGIGISAAVLYAQLTSGLPTVVISRTGHKEPAYRFEIQIKIETNEPDIISQGPFEWDRIHGTRVQIEFKSTMAARKKLIEYLRYTSVVNPHARFRVELDDEAFTFERVSQEVIACPVAIQPHPHGIEFGQLKRMAAASGDNLLDFLVNGFSRVGRKSAQDMCDRAGLKGTVKVNGLSTEQLKALLAAMQAVAVPAPPSSQCLSPIGEELIRRGLDKEFQMDFVAARTRPSSVFSGHSFMVEAAIGYGGKLPSEGNAIILRFANRVPLMYQQGACAITDCVSRVNWKSYNLSQQGLPMGPVLILVHVASTNVPFTSESKDAIASIPEIEKEIVLALQDLGRDLKLFVSRRDKSKLAEDRARAVCAIIPEIAEKVSEIVEKPLVDTSPIEGKLMRKLIVKKGTRDGKVAIELANYSSFDGEISVYDISADNAADAVPGADFTSEMDGQFTKVWKITVLPKEVSRISYTGKGGGIIEIRGIDDNKKMVVDLDV
ncbi:DNA topoisomerase VI subunit B [uncultured Methanoregula sp.]|uniref:DNA topoisomerase VI subunit B n=1 Tax=uncultured Methanoregula sp. TaxID=1005933 RepID=UPI002AAB760B|nr:DNA topoisomerase VI subunit B [uncultured Methanoregula sp.]